MPQSFFDCAFSQLAGQREDIYGVTPGSQWSSAVTKGSLQLISYSSGV
jgi:hypothetical protein